MARCFQFRVARITAGCVLAWGLALGALAQRMPSYQHQRWSTDAGLPQSSVHQILQSSDGYLWLATEGGAVRYDGVSFKVFQHANDPSFTSDDVSSIAEDTAGDIWFGTADGLIEKTSQGMHRFTEADGLPAASILALQARPDGSLMITTAAGRAVFRGGKFQTVGTEIEVPDTSLHGSTIAGSGTHWSWDARAISAQEQETLHTWRAARELPGTRIQAVVIDPTGDAWVGTNRGLVRLSSSRERVVSVPELNGESVLAILRDREGDLWIGTETSGLHALRPRKFHAEPLLANDEVSCLAQATDGSMWIGTSEDGVRHLLVSAAGDSRIEDVDSKELTSPIILSIAAGKQRDVWVGTPDGLNHIEASGRVTRYTSADGLPDDLVRSLLVAKDGTLWAGTRGGLARFRNGQFATLTAENGLGGNLIGPLFEEHRADRPVLWVATLTGVTRVQDDAMTSYTSGEGLQSNLVTGITSDTTGRIWVSSRDAGLFLYHDGRFVKIAAKGISDDLEGIIVDQQDMLWLREKQSVKRVSADEMAACAFRTSCHPGISVYDTADGMESAELVPNGTPSAIRAEDGSLWFATRSGVAITDTGSLARNMVVPPVVIERFIVDGEDVATGPGVDTLASRYSRYTFEFAALSFVAPSKVRYRYRLEGFDKNWSDAEARRSATYTNLPAGTYVFHVLASNNDGVWNETGASVRFRIEPPVYRRWWFLVLAAMLLAAFVVMLYRLRLERLHRDFNTVLAERNRIAREIHDTLAQDFVGVSLQLDLIAHFLAQQDIGSAKEQLKGTRSFVQEGIEEARRSIWNLRSNMAADSLPARVTALATRFTRGPLTVGAKLSGVYRALPPHLEKEVLRILQEALHNVERHSSASDAQVRLVYEDDTLIMVIEDNGCGFSLPEATGRKGHFGLRGMRERAADIEGRLEILSVVGEGTTVTLTVPIAETHEKSA